MATMRVEVRPATALLALAVVLAVGTVGSAGVVGLTSGETYDPNQDLIPVDDQNTETADGERALLWPYTSRATDHETRTLAINVLVYGDPDDTRYHLTELSRGDWNETTDEEEDIEPAEAPESLNGTTTAWRTADGAIRYIYVTDGSNGQWLTESYQLHDGDYLGTRHHIRAYNSPHGEEWTAMQAHYEHWDWFRLRHTVTSVEESQTYVEREFMGRWFVDDVWRKHAGNDFGQDSDGWMTVVELSEVEDPDVGTEESSLEPDTADRFASLVGIVSLVGLLFPALAVGTSRRGPTGVVADVRGRIDRLITPRARRSLTLVLALVGVMMLVRFGAIGLERTLDVSPKAIAGSLYPLIFVGMPVTAYLLARQLESPFAFTAASIGFIAAVMLDSTYVGVGALPLDVFIHRGGLAVALGFIAIGGSRTERYGDDERGFVRMGVLLWLVTLVLPLIRFV